MFNFLTGNSAPTYGSDSQMQQYQQAAQVKPGIATPAGGALSGQLVGTQRTIPTVASGLDWNSVAQWAQRQGAQAMNPQAAQGVQWPGMQQQQPGVMQWPGGQPMSNEGANGFSLGDKFDRGLSNMGGFLNNLTPQQYMQLGLMGAQLMNRGGR